MTDQDALKRAAAEAAVAEIRTGMKLGLGTGSTIAFALDALARRIREEGLRIAGIPTSLRTEARAKELGIPLTNFSETPELDLAIDGADEVVEGSLALIKGLGGALLRERIVAAGARRFIVIVDQSKVSGSFGSLAPIPVEVVPFGHEATARRLDALGAGPVLRADASGAPIVTDGRNVLYDCHGFPHGSDPALLARSLRQTVGVIDSGIFVGMASEALVAVSTMEIRRLTPTVVESSHV